MGEPGRTGQAELVTRSLKMGANNSVVFTLTPFYFWYAGIARCGVARTDLRVR